MTNIEQFKEKAISIICACRIGGMDNNQFKATLEFNIDSIIDQAVQARNEELVELLETAVNDYIEKAKVRELYVESIPVLEVDRIINLISPGRK